MLYSSSALTARWGRAYFFPTKTLVRGFGAISADNKRIIRYDRAVAGGPPGGSSRAQRGVLAGRG